MRRRSPERPATPSSSICLDSRPDQWHDPRAYGVAVRSALGYAVMVQHILGPGDAFGAGFLYGYVKGWNLRKAARLGNACGAMAVTRHGCSISMPLWDEVMAFADERGGL